MRNFLFLKLAAAVGLVLAAPAASVAQISTIDPNSSGEYEPAVSGQAEAAAPVDQGEYVPLDAGPEVVPAAPATAAPVAADASVRASEAVTVPADDIFGAAEGVFGKGAEGLADLIEDILKERGQPSAYITGKEASGAFVLGARYGSGTLHHRVEGDRPIYWTGPSLGFDFGADASKVFVLVYNLNDSQDIFKRYPAGEGKAYVVGGLTAGYLRRGNVVLIPVRMGAGLRLGLNAGYMRFSEKNRWLPF
jgi:hypothetical protein